MSIESDLLQCMPCPVCSGDHITKLFDLESPYINRLFYCIQRCHACGHRYANGPVSEQILSTVYGGAFHATSQQQADGPASAILLNATRRARWLHECGLRGRLLDVGAGRGYFVKTAQEFFDARGIDYSPDAIQYGQALGVQLDSGDFLRAPYQPATFDVLTFWDVLASMVDVRATMARAAVLLRPGGHAVFTVPMADSLACRISGKRWPLWIPPVNLHYFSRQSLERLFRESGFEVVRMAYQVKRVSLNFLCLKLARSLGSRRLEGALAKMPLRWAVPVNLCDIQTALIRRV